MHNPQFSLVPPPLHHIQRIRLAHQRQMVKRRPTRSRHSMQFFQLMQLPPNLHRHNGSIGDEGFKFVYKKCPFAPGANTAEVNTFKADLTSPTLFQPWLRYMSFVNNSIKTLYPNPTELLRKNLNIHLQFFYKATQGDNCTQVFPYGRD